MPQAGASPPPEHTTFIQGAHGARLQHSLTSKLPPWQARCISCGVFCTGTQPSDTSQHGTHVLLYLPLSLAVCSTPYRLKQRRQRPLWGNCGRGPGCQRLCVEHQLRRLDCRHLCSMPAGAYTEHMCFTSSLRCTQATMKQGHPQIHTCGLVSSIDVFSVSPHNPQRLHIVNMGPPDFVRWCRLAQQLCMEVRECHCKVLFLLHQSEG